MDPIIAEIMWKILHLLTFLLVFQLFSVHCAPWRRGRFWGEMGDKFWRDEPVSGPCCFFISESIKACWLVVGGHSLGSDDVCEVPTLPALTSNGVKQLRQCRRSHSYVRMTSRGKLFYSEAEVLGWSNLQFQWSLISCWQVKWGQEEENANELDLFILLLWGHVVLLVPDRIRGVPVRKKYPTVPEFWL